MERGIWQSLKSRRKQRLTNTALFAAAVLLALASGSGFEAAAQSVTVNPVGGGGEGLGGIGAAADYTYTEVVGIIAATGAVTFIVYAVGVKWGLPKQGLAWILGITVLATVAKPLFDGVIGAVQAVAGG